MNKKNAVFLLLFLLLTGISRQASAGEVTACHCFSDRTYNPAERFAADDYMLVTGFNSFLARSFAISKREIIMMKMQKGVRQDDLIVGLHTAKAAGLDLAQVLELLQQSGSWEKTLLNPQISARVSRDKHLRSIQTGTPPADGSRKIVDELLSGFYMKQAELIEKLRKTGLSEKEINLIFILEKSSGKKPQYLAGQFKKEGKSWSEIASSLGIAPEEAGKLVMNYSATAGAY